MASMSLSFSSSLCSSRFPQGKRRFLQRDLSFVRCVLAASKSSPGGATKKRLWKEGEFPGITEPTNPRQTPIKNVKKKLDMRSKANAWVNTVTETLSDLIAKKQEQPFYQPKQGTYIKLLVLLGKSGQPRRAQKLFDEMLEERLEPTAELYTALLAAYCRSNLIDEAFSTLERMKSLPQCQPDVFTTQSVVRLGRDDHNIKVWNYKDHICSVTLAHENYVRAVQFHRSSKPWIVSASDDKIICIWNWQSQTCISVLTGHDHYVMCASFHPKEDLVVSTSLDQTVSVWDIGSLVKKTKKTVDINIKAKYVLKGHDDGVGVNWASFHPTLPLIVSGADNGQVKLWRFNGVTKAWEENCTPSGHTGPVSSVVFHAKQDIIVSSFEDKSIRVWNASSQTEIQTFSREDDRFWILAVNLEGNLLAAGNDKGMMVFKLAERKRPACALSGGDSFFYANDPILRCYEYSSRIVSEVIHIQRPMTLSCCLTNNAVLICSDLYGGSYHTNQRQHDRVSDSMIEFQTA